MSLLKKTRISYKPFEYQWAYQAWLAQQQMHWLPEEVAMADDVHDWKKHLTTAEKNLCTQIFRFFTQADIEVLGCYAEHYASLFQPIEIRMMLTSFQNMETIHVAAYANLIDTMGMPDEIYEEFLQYKAMKSKYDYLHRFKVDTKDHIALTLAGYGGFVEGVQLFASFAMLMNFQRFGKMKGMGQIVAWSVRDETLHSLSIMRLFRTFIRENPEIWTSDLRAAIYDVGATMVYFEDAFIDLAFEINGCVEGLTANEVKRYIRYIADRRLSMLGLKPQYLIEENPLPWMDYILNGLEFVNFFENRSTEYSKAATSGTWDDAFAIHDTESEDLQLAKDIKIIV